MPAFKRCESKPQKIIKFEWIFGLRITEIVFRLLNELRGMDRDVC